MSKKVHGKPRADVEAQRQRAERELAKGNAKAALKEAELCHRQAASPENRRLLEQAYLARIEQLARLNQTADALGVLERLQSLGASTPEIAQQLPRLRLLLGDRRVDSAALFAQHPALAVELADRAVLDASRSCPVVGELVDGVRQVRAALDAIERGEDAVAAELLRTIPRDSPLSEWKLLARGLSAFYQRDRARMQDNWQRLDAGRPACRIAQSLLVIAGDLPPENSSLDANGLRRRVEAALPGAPIADALRDMASYWRDGDWRAFFAKYRPFRQRHAAAQGPLLDKVVELIVHRAVRDRQPGLLQRLIQLGPAPAIDPKWNRARAMMEESIQRENVSPLEDYWLAYANDLAKSQLLRADDKAIAAGLVYLRLARHFVRFGDDTEAPKMFRAGDNDLAAAFWKRAEQLFEESLRRCPDLEDAYRGLARLHSDQEDEVSSAAVWRRFAARRPNDYDAQLWLANFHLGQDEPADSQPYVEAALRLRPRDPRTTVLGWNQRITNIRCLAKQRKFDAAREEWQKAAQRAADTSSSGFAPTEPYTLDAMRAGIEFKAKQPEVAQQFVEAAIGRVEEPTVVWLQMSSIAARYTLPREIKKDFDTRFAEAIGQQPTSATAGRLAKFLSLLKANQVNYTGRATQERLVLKYIQRAERIAWTEGDLSDVCTFLASLPRQFWRQEALVEIGLKQFPSCPYFHVALGNLEISRGPWGCERPLAIRHFRRALELLGIVRGGESLGTPATGAAGNPAESLRRAKMVEDAQRGLSLLGDDGRPLEDLIDADDDYEEDDDEFGFDEHEDDDDEDDVLEGDDLEDDDRYGRVGRGTRGRGRPGKPKPGAKSRRSMPLFAGQDDQDADDQDADDQDAIDEIDDDMEDGDTTSGFSPGLPAGLNVQMLAKMMMRLMPSDLKRELQQIARQMGLKPEEVMAQALASPDSPLAKTFAANSSRK